MDENGASQAVERLDTRCCIAGGGPAGMMLGFLLARAGVPVVVLEKHGDFLRDFRGDTIHPSTLELMHELGLLEDFLALPHQETRQIGAQIGDRLFNIADLSHLPTHCKFLALMPQWDFLDFLAARARRLPGFSLRMQTEATALIRQGGRIAGVQAQTPQGRLEIRCELLVAADGRHSILRKDAGLEVIESGAPMDVLWMRLPRHSSDQDQTLGRVGAGHILVMLNRGNYWQCALVIRKGGYQEIRERGLEAFRNKIIALAPYLKDRTDQLRDWDEIKLLTVTVDHLRQWQLPGFLCIGDSAHAMSPIGGVGVNLAIQDAVAAANLLAEPLLHDTLTFDALRAVQERRQLPTFMTQRLQLLVQNRIIGRVLASGEDPAKALTAPWPLRLLGRLPLLQRLPARLVGLGFRPEHIRSPIAG